MAVAFGRVRDGSPVATAGRQKSGDRGWQMWWCVSVEGLLPITSVSSVKNKARFSVEARERGGEV